jgi:20S proteasome alpha/beta subunit
MIFGGVDELGPQLLQADPSGACWKYKAVAIGIGSDTVKEILEKEYDADCHLEDAVTLAVKCLSKVAEGGIIAENVRVATVPTKTKEFTRLSTEEITGYISRIG